MILVTGGTGLVGAHLLLNLAENESAIRAIFRNKTAIAKTKKLFYLYKKENLFDKIDWIHADITDIHSLNFAFQNIDYVYHCAGLISYDPKDEALLRKINIEGTANVVNFCIAFKIKKLCHVSSIAALGSSQKIKSGNVNFNTSLNHIITEDSDWHSEGLHSDYAISKYGAEIEVFRGQQEGLNIVIVNPGVIFGAGFWNQGSGLFFSAIKNGFPFYTEGSTGYVGVTDVVKVMMLLMQSNINGERFTLVSENISFKDIIFNIAEKLNAPKPKIRANRWLTSLGWRLDWFNATFFGRKRRFSKYSANALHSKEIISNEKVKLALNFKFQNINSVIKEVVSLQK